MGIGKKRKSALSTKEFWRVLPYNLIGLYHHWMQSEELQHLTASEPLTLDEEYRMQQTWLQDDDKCTFIILDKAAFDATGDEIGSMIGDTNLFLLDSEEQSRRLAEAEIMIAETEARGKRFGWEAMLLMLRFGCEKLRLDKYQVKIALENTRSIAMFTKLGFIEVGRSNVFQETTLEKTVCDDWRRWLTEQTSSSQETTSSNVEDVVLS